MTGHINPTSLKKHFIGPSKKRLWLTAPEKLRHIIILTVMRSVCSIRQGHFVCMKMVPLVHATFMQLGMNEIRSNQQVSIIQDAPGCPICQNTTLFTDHDHSFRDNRHDFQFMRRRDHGLSCLSKLANQVD